MEKKALSIFFNDLRGNHLSGCMCVHVYVCVYIGVHIKHFDWIQIIVAVAGKKQRFEDNITKNVNSVSFFLIYVLAVFQRGHLETLETKLYYGSTATTAY